jgi:Ca2+-binding RTX toxin-like protein
VQLDGFHFTSFAAVQAAMKVSVGGVVLDLGCGETLTFDNMTPGSFSEGNFILGSTPAPTTIEPYPTNQTLFSLPLSAQWTSAFTGSNKPDRLKGTGGHDLLDGRSNGDLMAGGASDDTYLVDHAKDIVTESAEQGVDTVETTISGYTLPVHVENLVLGTTALSGSGNNENNYILGNDLDNSLQGAAGNDILVGRLGADTLSGGEGRDIFVLQKMGDAGDVITDFRAGDDGIDVRDLMRSLKYTGLNPLKDGYLILVQQGNDTLLRVDPTGSFSGEAMVLIQGIDAHYVHLWWS